MYPTVTTINVYFHFKRFQNMKLVYSAALILLSFFVFSFLTIQFGYLNDLKSMFLTFILNLYIINIKLI